MAESTEGIGAWKWSFESVNGEIFLNQGKYRLARLERLPADMDADEFKIRHLLVSAPQLWDAANELAKAWERSAPTPELVTLRNAVAKAVGKTAWSDVAQSP